MPFRRPTMLKETIKVQLHFSSLTTQQLMIISFPCSAWERDSVNYRTYLGSG